MAFVKWTDDEKERLIAAVVEARILRPAPSLLTLLNEVQREVLVPERRRRIRQHTHFPELLGAVELRLLERCTFEPGAMQPEKAAAPVIPPGPEEALKAASVAQLFAALGAKVDTLLSRMQPAAEKPEGPVAAVEAVKEQAAEKPAERKKEKSVLVVGLLPAQCSEVAAAASPLRLSLRFARKDKAAFSIPPGTDYVIVDKHSRHGEYNAARKYFERKGISPGGRVFFSYGGHTNIVDLLREISEDQSSAR